MTREQELDEFLELFAIRPYDRARENLIALIDSATREARLEGYKKGYIDAGIKALTEKLDDVYYAKAKRELEQEMEKRILSEQSGDYHFRDTTK